MLLEGKRYLVTGVLNDASIAFSVARRAQENGAEVVLTSFGRAMSLTQRTARRLPKEAEVVELDVTNQEHLDGLAGAVALQISAYSLKGLAVAALPLMSAGGSIVGLDFDNTQAFPVYDWMGVAKSALESAAR